jgi:hypothetical protein
MRRETNSEREAWTALVEGRKAEPAANKYGVAPKSERGKYASKHEAEVAASLAALERGRKIVDLREQVRFVLVPKNGKLRAVVYVADFAYRDYGTFVTHIVDAKGYKTPVYRLKKRLMQELGYTVEEV